MTRSPQDNLLMHQAGNGRLPKQMLIVRTLEQKNHSNNRQSPHGVLRCGVHAGNTLFCKRRVCTRSRGVPLITDSPAILETPVHT